MRRFRGRRQKRRLPLMAIVPPPNEPYHAPPPEECEEFTQRTFLAPDHLLTIRRMFRIGQSTVVEFGANQVVRVDGKWVDVARIDSDHGMVHRHQFYADGRNVVALLETIPLRGGEELVDRWCAVAEDVMQNEWEDNFRRWNGDDQ